LELFVVDVDVETESSVQYASRKEGDLSVCTEIGTIVAGEELDDCANTFTSDVINNTIYEITDINNKRHNPKLIRGLEFFLLLMDATGFIR
jgi:hypothetical protein